MSSKKKRIAKGLGASALAVATLASGLSFGATSASASPTEIAESKAILDPSDLDPSTWGRFHGTASGAGLWKHVSASLTGGGALFLGHQTEASARQAVSEWALPEAGKWQHFLTRTAPGNAIQCIEAVEANNPARLLLRPARCSATAINQMFSVADGKIVSYIAPLSFLQQPEAAIGTPHGIIPKTPSGETPLEGEWGGMPIGQSAKLAGSVEFAAGVDARAVVKGSTEASGRVEIRRGETVIASGDANANGDYSIAIPAPDKAGDDELTVALVENNADKKTIKVIAAYGAGVAITSPENNENVSGQYEIRGNAQTGSNVTVRLNNGAERAVDVNGNGQWSANVTLPMGETTITATQKSKGANTTTSAVTVNPGQTQVELSADGRFDAEDPTRPAVAFGSAPTGSTVVLRNAAGVEIGRVVAAGDAYQIPIDPARAVGGVNTFSVVIEGAESEPKSFVLNYGQAGSTVTVTTPEKNDTVGAGIVEFAGSGQADAKVVVRGSSREVASATVNAQGAWSASSVMALGEGKYDLYFDQVTKGGLTKTVRHAFTVGEVTAPIVEHTVTAPGDGEVVDTLRPTFEGRGHEGAEITVRGASRTIGSATVTNGTWKIETPFDLSPMDYNLYVEQRVNNTLTGTLRAKFTVSPTAFRQLVLTAPGANESVLQLQPTFVGTATPEAEIWIGTSRTTVATGTVNADGTFSIESDIPLARGGTYNLEVKQTTAAGKTSSVQAPFTIDRNAQ
ncbi:Ig-like domain-containing protein [Curtobacterium sp. USHLN213]|uniref:Ig-like domain-containing protein n=1 Tax=Curtobacterium sp. USHLN213 TaxID=3081255 RepID=UPI0030171EC0